MDQVGAGTRAEGEEGKRKKKKRKKGDECFLNVGQTLRVLFACCCFARAQQNQLKIVLFGRISVADLHNSVEQKERSVLSQWLSIHFQR